MRDYERAAPVLADLMQRAAAMTGTNEADLLSRKRTARIATARALVMFAAMDHLLYSSTVIGAFFRRSHSTVLHGRNLIANTPNDEVKRWRASMIAIARAAANN